LISINSPACNGREVPAQGNESIEDPLADWPESTAEADRSLNDRGVSVRNIKSIYVENLEATVDNARLVKYRVNAKIPSAG